MGHNSHSEATITRQQEPNVDFTLIKLQFSEG